MAEPTSPCLYEEEYRIEKRADGTEDFHCILASCTGIFSYRTLRALNNHRASTHSLPDIPKRKRGPKKNESSRIRSRSADAVKRQVMKRAIDISKREQGCKSMARLRASRLAMAQAGELLDSDHMTTVIKEVDKSLENWEGGASRRRLLLERRIQMAKLEWAMKGEELPLSGTEVQLPKVKDTCCFHVGENEHAVETAGEGREFPGTLFRRAMEGEVKERCAMLQPQHDTSFSPQIMDSLEETSPTRASEMGEGNLCHVEVPVNGENGFMKNVLSSDKYEARHVWHNYSVRKFISMNHHELKLLNERDFTPSFERDKVSFEYSDPRQA